jgi:hypothetical protein
MTGLVVVMLGLFFRFYRMKEVSRSALAIGIVKYVALWEYICHYVNIDYHLSKWTISIINLLACCGRTRV